MEETSKHRDTLDEIVRSAEYNHFRPEANPKRPAATTHKWRAGVGQTDQHGFGWVRKIPDSLRTTIVADKLTQQCWAWAGHAAPVGQDPGPTNLAPGRNSAPKSLDFVETSSQGVSLSHLVAMGQARSCPSDHSLRTAHNEAKTEEALLQIKITKKRRWESALKEERLNDLITLSQAKTQQAQRRFIAVSRCPHTSATFAPFDNSAEPHSDQPRPSVHVGEAGAPAETSRSLPKILRQLPDGQEVDISTLLADAEAEVAQCQARLGLPPVMDGNNEEGEGEGEGVTHAPNSEDRNQEEED